MWVDYRRRIGEDEAELARQERRLRGRRAADRARMLRLLKVGAARSLRALAPMLGYSERHLRRWWAAYARDGLAALLGRGPRRGGRQERVNAEAWAGLEAAMAAGRIARLEDARRYLLEEWGVAYASLNGVSRLLKRRGAKLKTGRRRHRRADPAAQAAFKKSAPGGARRAPGAAGVRDGRGQVRAQGAAPPPLVPARGAAALGGR